eukprot:TRINITY_DN3381_c0_g4_i1.p1 TRINITY_DN3381_c0_g4~~TRINITY_DN3381_c0_g4_i1.p1  ORF type:complete len:171 (-),score=12.62 TRINITY_DN3381_c0_g4_i1:625-1137(-)
MCIRDSPKTPKPQRKAGRRKKVVSSVLNSYTTIGEMNGRMYIECNFILERDREKHFLQDTSRSMQIHKQRITKCNDIRKVSYSQQDDHFLLQFQKVRERNRAFTKLRKDNHKVVKEEQIKRENKKLYSKLSEISARRFVRNFYSHSRPWRPQCREWSCVNDCLLNCRGEG